MGTGSLKELYLDELADLYGAETHAILTLARLGEAAHAPALRRALAGLGVHARLHLERLQLVFTHWGETRRAHRCAGLVGVVQEADDRLNESTTEAARDAAIIAAAQRIAHYEIAAYEGALVSARWLNRLDDVRLLQETIDDQRRADLDLLAIAEQGAATIALDYRPGDATTPAA